ncbi:MAG: mitochondrial fission ELM1 family protein [Alphaproteobacteria bacterium]
MTNSLDLRCWVLSDGDKVGSYNQGLGLAQALGLPLELKKMYPRFPWSHIPARFWFAALSSQSARGDTLAPPWPDVIISIGRASAAPAVAIRKRTGCFTICLMNPRISLDNYDVVIAPVHDGLTGPNVINTRGPLHLLTDQSLQEAATHILPLLTGLPRPYHAVLLGGHNIHGMYTPAFMETIAQNLITILQHYGGTLLITPSRRTPKELVMLLHQRLEGHSFVLWEKQELNPYQGFLGVADAVFVIGDSVSMSGEACFTGKPVFIIEPPFTNNHKKFTAFLNSLYQHRHAQAFSEQNLPPLGYTTTRLDEMGGIVSALRGFMAGHPALRDSTCISVSKGTARSAELLNLSS